MNVLYFFPLTIVLLPYIRQFFRWSHFRFFILLCLLNSVLLSTWKIYSVLIFIRIFLYKKKVWRKLKILHIFLVLANFVTREKTRIYDICNVILILKTFQKNWSLVQNVFKFKYSFSDKKWIHLDDFSVSSSEFQRVIFYI